MQLFANDYNDNRVHIDDTHSNQQYYCPSCGVPLVVKKGDIRHHHFAHSAHCPCKDSWERNKEYDTSSWHIGWQSLFPQKNQEITLSLGETKHRADVIIGKTVVEFQHSLLPASKFDDRNNFYFNLGYKVVWLFDISALLQKGKISYQECQGGLLFLWKNPKEAFNAYEVQSGQIDLFFQISEEYKCIVRVKEVSPAGFERFTSSYLLTKDAFLDYVGVSADQCLPPDMMGEEQDAVYSAFKQKYNITLNKQQERALQAVEGANLLLAVPGSGKTTVLVDRLGYMVHCKGIDPKKILAITFATNAAAEMKNRYSSLFGEDTGEQITFRTINSLSLNIYGYYCWKKEVLQRTLIPDKELKQILSKLYRKYYDVYAAENDIVALRAGIDYVKNMMLTEKQIRDIDRDYPHFSKIYVDYQNYLAEKNYMDYNDQMGFAYSILKKDSEMLREIHNRYHYICVDEAQDTSKIQHAIIQMLAGNNNIFMVGDEDQSIYGFRAAYPRALLNFRYTYKNPYILRMEKNYRSTPEIVDLAQRFISRNKGRYEKHMVASREGGENVRLVKVKTREEQFQYLIEVAKNMTSETAFLYRDNETAVVLVDSLLRANIDFRLRKPEMNFFGNKVVKDIIAYLSLSVNELDYDSFDQIVNQGILYLGKQQKKCAINTCRFQHISILDCLDQQMDYVRREYRYRAGMFRELIETISECSSYDAIDLIMEYGYYNFLSEKHLDKGKVEILRMLAKNEPVISKFLNRLKELEGVTKAGMNAQTEQPLVLSTIHSSKGLEYDTVYIIDVYDGRFPSSRPNPFSRAKDNADGEMEERRLFYVGMTRAKNHLAFISIESSPSTYLEELFPTIREEREEKEETLRREQQRIREEEEKARIQAEEQKRQEQQRIWEEQERARLQAEEERKQEAKRAKAAAEKALYDQCHEEAIILVDQQEMPAIDSTGRRWAKCMICGEVKPSKEFTVYGGIGTVNLGKCKKCYNTASSV